LNVAIVGKMGSGKSTLANHLVDVHKYTRVANAGALKALATMAYGPIDKGETYRVTERDEMAWDEQWKEREISGRQVLQGIGQIVKEFDRDFWLKAMMRDVATKGNGPFVCDDTRFPFEADFLRERGWLIVKLYVAKEVRAQRYESLYGRAPTEAELNHPSETEVDDIKEDLGFSGESPVQDIVKGILDHIEWVENDLV
jgi:energy-coupling factor transporter ATP-binding protein EcfA2